MYGQIQDDSVAAPPAQRLPLEGVVVLSVEQFGAGPWATLQLADMGARVIKIEDPSQGGDVARYVPPYNDGEDSLFFEAFNRGKESVSLDLRSEAGRAVFADLVREADVVFCNLRGDLPERLGLTYEKLGEINERIVCGSLSGYGRTGPDAAVGAYDYVIQARAGWMSLTGEPTGPPTRTGLSLVDFGAGYVAAMALLAGVLAARSTGRGCDCDVSLFETALALSNYVGTWTATAGYEPGRQASSAHPSVVPFQQFRTRDGWIVVACAKEKFWRALCDALGLDALLEDPRAAGFAARHANRDWVVAELERRFEVSSTEELLADLRAAGVPCGPVNTLAAAFADEQAVARSAVASYEHPVFGVVRTPASPLRVGAAPRQACRAPRRGEHTEALLGELCGYDADRVAALRDAKAFG
jgi:crotonobetainyl-CoA:carnitine CoA-transferase CaiB-like acyl-CoA transferase